MLPESGTSIRAPADYVGHAYPGFTLRTYTHLMPTAEDKARRAVDHAYVVDGRFRRKWCPN